ncbi:MAG: histidine kinase, partial [Actinobacteria bacterium]|nr:histidine kinase [Actinomycetota bacterium]
STLPGIGYLITIWTYDPHIADPALRSSLNLLLVRNNTDFNVFIATRFEIPIFITCLLLTLGILIARSLRASKPARRVYAPLAIPAVILCLAYTSYLVFQETANAIDIYTPPLAAYTIAIDTLLSALLLLPVGYLLGMSLLRSRRSRVGKLVVEFGSSEGPSQPPAAPRTIRDAVARTLGDPSVEIGYWSAPRLAYLTEDGKTLETPPAGARRVATPIERDGEAIAVIVHDEALLEEPDLVRGVGAAAGLALDNARLQAELRAQLEEVRASRARIVEAGDAARQRLERDLHDGAQQQLVGLLMLLQMAENKAAEPELQELIAEAKGDLENAIDNLRELARGMHPAALAQDGLKAAIAILVERARIPVHCDPTDERFPLAVESTAYFVIAEALTNIARHARAARAWVRLFREGGSLIVEVSDDGIGGATPTNGSGLRGLDDRVATVGGRLFVESPSGDGTTVRAEIPCT